MSKQYETLDGFRKKLKSGHYDSVTGARRAIGKMRTWEEKDKEAGRRAVDKHFGATPSKPAKPRPAAKKTPKRAPKKAPSEAPTKKKFQRKKRPAKKEAGSAQASKKTSSKNHRAPRTSKARSSKSTVASVDIQLRQYGEAVGLYEKAAGTLKNCASKDVDVTGGLQQVSVSVTSLLAGMDKQIVQPLTELEQKGVSLFNVSAPTAPEAPQAPAVVPPTTNGAGVTPPMPPAQS